MKRGKLDQSGELTQAFLMNVMLTEETTEATSPTIEVAPPVMPPTKPLTTWVDEGEAGEAVEGLRTAAETARVELEVVFALHERFLILVGPAGSTPRSTAGRTARSSTG
jgi:hypothetical protein